MNTIINTSLSNSFEVDFAQAIEDNPEYAPYISFNQTTGLVQTNIFNKEIIQWIWQALGKKYPLVCILHKDSVFEERLTSFYAKLSEESKTYIEIEKAEVGSRISVYISQEREDIQESFWKSIFPQDDTDTKMTIAGRTRDYNDSIYSIMLEEPEDENTAVRLAVWDQMKYANGNIYVTPNLFRQIKEEIEIGSKKKTKEKVKNSQATRKQKER